MHKPSHTPSSPFRNDCLQDRVAFVTGGGSGIGFEIARQLGLHGAKLCLMGRREPVLREACASLEKEGVPCCFSRGDVRQPDSSEQAIATCVKEFGHLDILVNCAAGNFITPIEDLSPNGFRTVMEIDTFGTFHVSRAAFSFLKQAANERGDACILNITADFDRPPFFAAHAAAAKMAIDSLTRSFSLEWSEYGIRVNGIAPGPIANTPGFDKLGGMGGGDPVGRIDSPSSGKLPRGLMAGLTWDIGMASVFLCSSAGGYISGDTLRVDGGSYLRRGVPVRKDGWLGVDRDMVKSISAAREKMQKKEPTGVAGSKSKL